MWERKKRGEQAGNTKVESRSEWEQRQMGKTERERDKSERYKKRWAERKERCSVVRYCSFFRSDFITLQDSLSFFIMFFLFAVVVLFQHSSHFLHFIYTFISFPLFFAFCLPSLFIHRVPLRQTKSKLVPVMFACWSHLHLHYVLGMQQMLPTRAKSKTNARSGIWAGRICVSLLCFFLGTEQIMQIDEKNRREQEAEMWKLKPVLFIKSLHVLVFITTTTVGPQF